MAKISCNVISYTLQRTVNITIILPSVTIPESLSFEADGSMRSTSIHHDYSHKLPVLYLLHGFGNNEQQWTGYANTELYAEERQIAVVMVSAENKFYVNHPGDAFYDFINEELPEFITQVFPVSKRKEDTYIAGLSMGGFGALYHGLKNPDKYEAIGAFSAAIGALKDYDLNDLIQDDKQYPDMYITIGSNDFLVLNNKRFHEKLNEHHINHTFKIVEGYEHEWRFWDKSIEAFLDWISRTDYYKDKKRKV